MICFPNAKINLGLHIVSRNQDGYHNLETLFYPIGLKDALEILPVPNANQAVHSEKFRFFPSGDTIQGETEDNLVIKALQLIAPEKELPMIDIHLLKKIPCGAGLGGGSSDAAFMLQLLNDTFVLDYSVKELMLLAAHIGADCPYFLLNKPAFATGIGNKLEPVELDLKNHFFVLVKPRISISTREAYEMITPQQPELSLKEIVKKPVSEWKKWMKNDFEIPIFKKYPEICRIKQCLYDFGAVYASMSGSGSSVFGLFEKKPEWGEAFKDYFVWSKKPYEW